MKYFLFTVLTGFTLNCFGQNSAGMPSGNIGIGTGTTAPVFPLHIKSSNGYLINLEGTGNFSGFNMVNSTSGKYLGLHYTTDGTANIGTNSLRFGRYSSSGWESNPVLFDMDAPELSLLVSEQGYIGSGTSNPLSSLHLQKSIDGEHRIIIQNTSTAPTSSSRIDLISSSTNAYSIIGLQNNGGNPYQIYSVGPGVNNTYFDSPEFLWRDLNGNIRMKLSDAGNIGVGISNPLAKLHVKGNGLFESTLEVKGDFVLGSLFNTVGKGKVLSFDNASNFDELSISRYNVASDQSELRVTIGDDGGSADGFIIGVNHYSNGWQPKFRFSADGRLSIGTFDMSPGYKLFVEEGIRTRKVKVDQGSWADFVFSPSYKLRSLHELKSFINRHHHLPDVPSEKEVVENGQDLGEMNKILLQKIEELTLYAIEQDERIKEQQAVFQDQTKLITNQNDKINELQSLLEKLSSRLSKLEQKQ